MTEKKPYYITTAIAYTSAKPHIGNTYEIVLKIIQEVGARDLHRHETPDDLFGWD